MKEKHRFGLCKIALGVIGIASIAFYVYNSFPATKSIFFEPDLSFMESHKEEIQELYKTNLEVGRWRKLGNGISKIAFTHEEYPGWVVKVPQQSNYNVWDKENVIRIHHENLEDIREIASQFDRISLPESYLYPTENGVVLVEEMFNLESCNINIDQQKTIMQFEHFVEVARLCDINPYNKHNAGILVNTTPPKIGIIDFDCRQKITAN